MRIRDWFRRRGQDAYTLDDGLPEGVEFRAIRCPHNQRVRLTLDYADVEPAGALARQEQARIEMATQIVEDYVARLMEARDDAVRVQLRATVPGWGLAEEEPAKPHHCRDGCRTRERYRIDDDGWPELYGVIRRKDLRFIHVCGAGCPERVSDGGPVRLGRPDPYDRTPVQCGCGGWMRPGQRHYCRGVA